MKKPNFAQIATSRSLKSQVDLFSKFEVNFLQKYLRCILTDHFSKHLINIHEEYFYKKFTQKITKNISSSLFELTKTFQPQQLLKGLTDHFKQRSISVSSGVFPTPVKLVFAPKQPDNKVLKAGELMYVDVKIRVEVARIEEIPGNIQNLITKFSTEFLHGHDKKLQDLLLGYKGEYFNIVIFYYGDIHFNFSKMKEYQMKTIKVGKKEQKVRLFVYYVSKIAMFETFKTTNKVNVECINDLVISFYDIRREKKLLVQQKKREKERGEKEMDKENRGQREKQKDKNKERQKREDKRDDRDNLVQNQHQQKPFDFKLILGAGGAICLGLLLVKVFS